MSEKPPARFALLLTGAASLLFICGIAFQWTLVDWVTPFLILPLLGVLSLPFLAAVGVAVFMLFARRYAWRYRLAPLAICVVTVLLVLFVPFTQLSIALDFK